MKMHDIIRSMINFIQSNQNLESETLNIIDNDIWDELLKKIKQREKIESISKLIQIYLD